MNINSAQIQMSSSYVYQQQESTRIDIATKSPAPVTSQPLADSADISASALSQFKNQPLT